MGQVVTCDLTAREIEVMQLIAWERLGNRQIARRLNVSVYTVKNHVHNIIEKLGVCDRFEAAQLAQKKQWLSLLPGRWMPAIGPLAGFLTSCCMDRNGR